jgi:hypothetical protein
MTISPFDPGKKDARNVMDSFRLFVRSAALLVKSLVKYGSIDMSDGEIKELAREIARPFSTLIRKATKKDGNGTDERN